jgi:hypothetical protein
VADDAMQMLLQPARGTHVLLVLTNAARSFGNVQRSPPLLNE